LRASWWSISALVRRASRYQGLDRWLCAVFLHLLQKYSYTKTTSQAGAVTLIQNFGLALNLNIHLHMLFLDGVYSANLSHAQFRWIRAPTSDELTQPTPTSAQRIGCYLERQGLLVRDAGNSYLTAESVDADSESPINQLLGSSISHRIAIGPLQGRKVFAQGHLLLAKPVANGVVMSASSPALPQGTCLWRRSRRNQPDTHSPG